MFYFQFMKHYKSFYSLFIKTLLHLQRLKNNQIFFTFFLYNSSTFLLHGMWNNYAIPLQCLQQINDFKTAYIIKTTIILNFNSKLYQY